MSTTTKAELEAAVADYQIEVGEYDQEVQRLNDRIAALETTVEGYALDAIYASTRIQDLDVERETVVAGLQELVDAGLAVIADLDFENKTLLSKLEFQDNVLNTIANYTGDNISVPIGLATVTLDGFSITQTDVLV